MTPEIILLFAVVWCGFFGGVAAFGYWRRHYTPHKWKKAGLTMLILVGGFLSLAFMPGEKRPHPSP